MTDHRPDDLEGRVRDAYRSAARTVHTLQQSSPMLTAGSARRPRRMNTLAPLAAAAAVLMLIGASLAIPRLAGSAQNQAAPGTSAPASADDPPFRVVISVSDSNRRSQLLVESAVSGHVTSTLAPPWQDAMWVDVAATADTARFIVAAAPASSPYTPTRLYSLTLSRSGAVTALTPLSVPTLPGEITSLGASADGRTVAYTTFGPGADYQVGVITGGRTRHWTVPAGVIGGMWHVSVSGDGGMLAVITQGSTKGGNEETAWVLPTTSAPGSVMARARKVYDHTYVGGAGHAMTILDSALISPDGRTLYLSTSASPARGTTVTAVTAYRTATGASLGTIGTWGGGYAGMLAPVNGMLLAWDQSSSIGYLINPATRTKTTLRLRGIPRAQYVALAW